MLERHELPATFFVPGHTVESFPDEVAVDPRGGHEIAHHSYAHIDPSPRARTRSAPTWSARSRSSSGIGVRPLGFRSPSADLSAATLELVEEHGFLYDSSLMADDYRPFHPRIGDKVARGRAARARQETRFWELPLSFELDDWVHFQFNFDPYRKGGAPASDVLEIWRGELDWMDANVDGGMLTVTMHPQVIGRGHRIAMLDSFVQRGRELGARFERMGDVAKTLV